jgi:hypothetical protein
MSSRRHKDDEKRGKEKKEVRHRHTRVEDEEDVTESKSKTVSKIEPKSKKHLPEIPDIVYSSGGNTFADHLRDRVADLCFGLLIILLVTGYVCVRLGLDPLDAGETLDSHPVMTKALATLLAIVLGAVSRRSPVASGLLDKTIGLAMELKNLASDRS